MATDPKKRFSNIGVPDVTKSFFEVLKWKAGAKAKKWPKSVAIKRDLKLFPQRLEIPDGEFYITLINHVTFLVQSKYFSFLTDPVFSDRASPFSFAGPKRAHAVGIPLELLPPLDAIFLSHNHYDHMDIPALQKIYQRQSPPLLTPLKNGDYLGALPADKIIELDWWQQKSLGDHAKITLVPAQHWSARSMRDRNYALWGGFVVETQYKRLYFAGDTGFGPFLNELHSRYADFDLSFLPIGAYEPRWFMKAQHMNPEDAVQAHELLCSKQSVGMHFGCFQLTDEGIDDPVTELKAALAAHKRRPQEFIAPQPGVTLRYTL